MVDNRNTLAAIRQGFHFMFLCANSARSDLPPSPLASAQECIIRVLHTHEATLATDSITSPTHEDGHLRLMTQCEMVGNWQIDRSG